MRIAIVYVILKLTGSQWSAWRTGVIWSRFLLPVTTIFAQFTWRSLDWTSVLNNLIHDYTFCVNLANLCGKLNDPWILDFSNIISKIRCLFKQFIKVLNDFIVYMNHLSDFGHVKMKYRIRFTTSFCMQCVFRRSIYNYIYIYIYIYIWLKQQAHL